MNFSCAITQWPGNVSYRMPNQRLIAPSYRAVTANASLASQWRVSAETSPPDSSSSASTAS